MKQKPKLLLHACCACCACWPIELLEPDYEITLFFTGSNLDSEEEYKKRLNALKHVSKHHDLSLIIDPYDHKSWLTAIAGFEKEPEKGKRCTLCFSFTLSRLSAYSGPFDHITTTLTVSPHKHSETIFKIAQQLSPKFLKINFKKQDGFKKTTDKSKEMALYRQNYCGCEFSKGPFTV